MCGVSITVLLDPLAVVAAQMEEVLSSPFAQVSASSWQLAVAEPLVLCLWWLIILSRCPGL